MKSSTIWLALALGLSCVSAQSADNARVIRVFNDVVAPADQQAYEAGSKHFNQCLHQHGFKYNWTAWAHETSDTYSYSYVSDPVPWASFDAMDAAIKACDSIIKSDVNPHLKSETSAFMEAMPESSSIGKDMETAPPLIEVTYFTIKPGHEAAETFEAATKKITAAAEKSHWPYHYQFGRLRDAGDGAPNYILVIPAKNWADLGAEPNPTVWKMVEEVYGKSSTDALRKSINAVIVHVSSHVDSYNADLTYHASGK